MTAAGTRTTRRIAGYSSVPKDETHRILSSKTVHKLFVRVFKKVEGGGSRKTDVFFKMEY